MSVKLTGRAISDVGISGDHGDLSGLADDDHPHYLLATGARVGASSTVQDFTSGVTIGGTDIYLNSDGSAVFNEQGAAVDFRVEGDTIEELISTDGASDIVGIGTTPVTNARLIVQADNTDATRFDALNTILNITPPGASSADHTAQLVILEANDGGDYAGTLNAMIYEARYSGSNTADELIGIRGRVDNRGGGTVTKATGFYGIVRSNASGGTIDTGYTFRALNPNISVGSITTHYGLYVENQTAATNNWAIVTEGGGVVFNESGTDSDLRIEGDTATNLLKVDAGLESVLIGTTTAGVIANFSPSLINLNSGAGDIDFKWSSVGSTDVVRFDAADNEVSFDVASISIAANTQISFGAGDFFHSMGTYTRTVSGDYVTNVAFTPGQTGVGWYRIWIPAQLHGKAVTIRSGTIYYALTGGSSIVTNNLYVITANGTKTDIDDDNSAQTGTSHSFSGLPYTLASTDVLYVKVSINAPLASTATFYGGLIVCDTD
jgi:hypothetical protein